MANDENKDGGREENNFTRVGAALLIGGALGAIAALLFAPKSGKETREDLRAAYERSRSKWKETQDDVADRIVTLVSDIQKKTDELLAGGKAIAEERRKDLHEALAIAKRALDEERALLRRMRGAGGGEGGNGVG